MTPRQVLALANPLTDPRDPETLKLRERLTSVRHHPRHFLLLSILAVDF